MTVLDVVADASVALVWFRSEGAQEIDASRALLDAQKARWIALSVLDLTACEIGNALLRGRPRATAEQTAAVLEALAEICPAVSLLPGHWRLATELAEQHGLTLYDAAYAAAARARGATLVTLDRHLLEAQLAVRPSELIARLGGGRGGIRARI